MIDERKLLAKLAEWEKESKEEAGLKAPALLRRVMEEVRHEATNEEIRERIEREDASDRWTPTRKKPPEKDDTYLCTLDGELCGTDEPFTGMCGFENGKWDEEGSVIAWMPLPEPYREEKEGGKTC